MKLTNSYNTVTVETEITADNYSDIMRHAPDALSLEDENGKIRYTACLSRAGAITDSGIAFDKTAENKCFYVSVQDNKLPADAEKRKAYLSKVYGPTLVKLQHVEQQVARTLVAIKEDIDAISDSITIVE